MAKPLPSPIDRAAQALLRVRATRFAVGHWPATVAERRVAGMSMQAALIALGTAPARPSERINARRKAAEIRAFLGGSAR